MFKIKLKAFFLHLSLSFIFVSLMIGIIVFFWYPSEYIGLTDFKGIALLVVSIDLILGPILTFVAFNPQKKSLKLDLAIIAMLQFSAFFYGVYALYQTHPLFITYNHDSFNLIQANEVIPSNAKNKIFNISTFSSLKFAFAQMPSDPEKQGEIMAGVDLKGEPDIDKRVEYYEPHQNHLDEILAKSLDSTKLFKEENLTKESRDFLKKYADYKNNFAYFSLRGRSKDAILVLNKETAEPITTINITPWKYVKK